MTTSAGPALGVREAAERCGVSQDTIRRRLRTGDFPRADRDDKQAWHIPVADLVAAGMNVRFTDATDATAGSTDDVAAAHVRIHQLEVELAAARAAAAVAEARAAHIDDLRAQVADLRGLAGLTAD